ncbi:MAG: ankyrin repeat domain-containing protein [Magnetococcus sp. DMHC-1]|nr:ankyrin repeat domain-containing protein [Magnetococcales bacterium]
MPNTTVKATSPIEEGITAAKVGHLPQLQKWLANNDPNQYDAEGWTPLLWGAARGHDDVVTLLLDKGADLAMAHRISGALPIHMAGHSGDLCSARLLLDRRPDQIDAVWDLNGHTILLQAVFYGHLSLAQELIGRGANTAITTARGLGPMELARQFENVPMQEIIRPRDASAADKKAYYASYLKKIAPVIPPEQKSQQDLADQLNKLIGDGLAKAAQDPRSVDATLKAVQECVDNQKADVNRLAGPLQQPPLVVVVTGNNGFPANPDVARLRSELAKYLLARGADPTLHERHPMGAQTIIRGAVFNHLDILRLCGTHISQQKLTDAINEIPIVNGLTAMHDTVLRASTASPDRFEGYLEQAAWFVANGGRTDMEDFSGRTQRRIAAETRDPIMRQRLLEVLDGKPQSTGGKKK